MSSTITFDPMVTTTGAGLFTLNAEGYVQGTAQASPTARQALAGGTLASSETLPMWGGVGIFENLSNSDAGSTVGRAANLAALTGFSVFDQASGMISTTSSPVPLAGPGMSVNFYRLGSGARIVVQCDSALSSLVGSSITSQVSWDFTNQKLIAYNATPGALPVKILKIAQANSLVVSYSGGNATWATGYVAVIQI